MWTPVSAFAATASCVQALSAFASPERSFSQAERAEAILAYAGPGKFINSYLAFKAGSLNADPEYLQRMQEMNARFNFDHVIEVLDSIAENSPGISQEVTVYRGENFLGRPRYIKGQIIAYNGYVSTTNDRDIANGFGGLHGDAEKDSVFQIYLKPGQKVIDFNRVMNRQGEQKNEILLPRGTKLRVDDIHVQDTRTILKMSVIEP